MEELITGINFFTAAAGENHIKTYAQYALRSLIKTGVPIDDIYVAVNTKGDLKILESLIPQLKNINIVSEKINHIKWKAHRGKRKFSVFKAAALNKTFPKPIKNKCLFYFDTDVLFFKNPISFLMSKSNKTWFHHTKDLEVCSVRKSRAGRKMKKSEVDINNYKLLSMWVSEVAAYCMVKRKAKILPDKEVVAGLYLLHPRDHKVLDMAYKNCLLVVKKFKNHVDVGDQKPFNAAINTLGIKWQGTDRFDPEHQKYFYHYFGTKKQKRKFFEDVKKLKLEIK